MTTLNYKINIFYFKSVISVNKTTLNDSNLTFKILRFKINGGIPTFFFFIYIYKLYNYTTNT